MKALHAYMLDWVFRLFMPFFCRLCLGCVLALIGLCKLVLNPLELSSTAISCSQLCSGCLIRAFFLCILSLVLLCTPRLRPPYQDGTLVPALSSAVPMTDFRCPTCSATFSDLRQLRVHQASHHQLTVANRALGIPFDKMVHSCQGMPICALCHRSFGRWSILQDHIRKGRLIRNFVLCALPLSSVQSLLVRRLLLLLHLLLCSPLRSDMALLPLAHVL